MPRKMLIERRRELTNITLKYGLIAIMFVANAFIWELKLHTMIMIYIAVGVGFGLECLYLFNQKDEEEPPITLDTEAMDELAKVMLKTLPHGDLLEKLGDDGDQTYAKAMIERNQDFIDNIQTRGQRLLDESSQTTDKDRELIALLQELVCLKSYDPKVLEVKAKIRALDPDFHHKSVYEDAEEKLIQGQSQVKYELHSSNQGDDTEIPITVGFEMNGEEEDIDSIHAAFSDSISLWLGENGKGATVTIWVDSFKGKNKVRVGDTIFEGDDVEAVMLQVILALEYYSLAELKGASEEGVCL